MQPPPEDEPDISRLIEVTYSSTTDPAQFFELIAVWKRYMDSIEDVDRPGPHLTHFNKALDILGAMGRRRRAQSRDDEILGAFAAPAFLCDRSLTVRNMNTAAERLPAQRRATLFDAPSLQHGIKRLNALNQTDIVPILDGKGRMTDCAVISLRDSPETSDADRERGTCLIVLTRPADSKSQTWNRLTEGFGLSAAESSVLYALMSGQSPDEIAAARGVSMNTVRSQIRKLLDKTSATSLSDLIRQTIMICTQIETVSLATRLEGSATAEDEGGLQSLLTSDGRLLSFRDLGDPEGRPILFLHNMTGGTLLPRRIQRFARSQGWRLIAPSRPGFGASDSIALRDMALLDRTVRDCRELMDHLGVPSVLVLGLMSSAGIALNFARTYPQRTIAVLNVAHAGVCDAAMVADMPNPARTLAQTMFRSTAATRFLVRVGIGAIDMLGPQEMIRRLISQSPADLPLLDDNEMVQAMARLLHHASVQGGEAFSKDGFVALTDFRPMIRSLHPDIPLLALLGGDDTIYSPAHARRLLSELPDYPVEFVPAMGQYLFYRAHDLVFQRADALWSKGAARLTGASRATQISHQK